jgi:acyl-CoA synthetase (AMP-forming)/AMP-acid ligase II
MSKVDLRADEVAQQLVDSDPRFAVTTKEIRGATLKVFKNTPPSLREYFEIGATHGDLDFLVYEDERYSFDETLKRAATLAHIVINDYGVKHGDRVAIAMRNYPEWIFSFIALSSVGIVVVPMNGWWTTEELDYGLEDSGAKLIIADKERCERIAPLIDGLGLKLITVRCAASDDPRISRYEDLTAAAGDQPMPAATISPEDDATILYTSGSTGFPKGAVSTHRGAISALYSWTLLGTSRVMVDLGDIEDPSALEGLPNYQPSTLMTIPLFHVTACHSIFMMSILSGRKIVLMYKWDAEAALPLIEQERITGFSGVPTMSWELLQSPNVDKYDLSSLADLSAGGAFRPPEHVKLLKEKFPNKSSSAGYGLTETNALGCVNGGDNYLLKPASTGRPIPPVLELKIVDENNAEVGDDERGEILLRGPMNVRGYWNKPEATAEAFSKDGWFRTGDIAIRDEDGFIFIVDRAKDIVIRGGENISCLEVEAAIAEHHDVLEVAVFGVPDERLGEDIAAAITPKDGASPSAEEIRAFLADHLSRFKIPGHIFMRPEKLPRIASGKVNKPEIRKLSKEWTAS